MTQPAALAERMPGISPEVYNDADFRAIAEIVYASSGNVLPRGKAMLVYSRIAPLVRESGCGTFANYVGLIRTDAEQQERAVAALTTNHTFFYREAHHFEHFESHVRPDMVQALERGGSARLWSAGCSSGEETWSLVMTLLGRERAAGRRLAGLDLRVLASDLAPHALGKAIAAKYPAPDLEAVPAGLVQAWTRPAGAALAITEEARALIRFRQLNLLERWPMTGRFDVIFCRNVMIYFDHATKEQLVSRFAEVLAPGGYLYIGHSERVSGPATQLLAPVGPTIYQRSAS